MKSLEELKAIKEKMRGQVEFRSEDGVWTEDNPYRKHVLVCGGTGCTSSGSKKIIEKLHEEIRKNSLENENWSRENRMFRAVCVGADYDRLSGGRILFHGKRRGHSGNRIGTFVKRKNCYSSFISGDGQ